MWKVHSCILIIVIFYCKYLVTYVGSVCIWIPFTYILHHNKVKIEPQQSVESASRMLYCLSAYFCLCSNGDAFLPFFGDNCLFCHHIQNSIILNFHKSLLSSVVGSTYTISPSFLKYVLPEYENLFTRTEEDVEIIGIYIRHSIF